MLSLLNAKLKKRFQYYKYNEVNHFTKTQRVIKISRRAY